MKRSRAPSSSQKKSFSDPSIAMNIPEKKIINSEQLQSGSIQVVRAPLFGFFQVSQSLRKKFQLPNGARIGRNSEELRKRKTLGARRPKTFMMSTGFKKPLQLMSPPKLELDAVDEEMGDANLATKEHVVREFEPLILSETPHVEVPHILAQWLRPHQREGVQFMFECVMSLRTFEGSGCILADDMGLGKTLQSIALLWTLLCESFDEEGVPIIKKVIVVCPTSLVKNWEAEIEKWLKGSCSCLALSETSRADVIKNMDIFIRTNMYKVLVVSYETLRIHIDRILDHKGPSACELLICDEAHRLKNADTATFKSLSSLPCSRRVLLSGTPLQNDLEEFYAMVDFANPALLGNLAEFRRRTMNPILIGREPDATDKEKERAQRCQFEMFQKVNEFILRRTNTLNAKHLPPKLVQVVCCRMTEIQQNIYHGLLNSKQLKQFLKGKQSNTLAYIGAIQKLCNHPKLLVMDEEARKYNGKESSTGLEDVSSFLPIGKKDKRVHPEFSGKMQALFLLCQGMRQSAQFCTERIVIISNYTQTLDVIGTMCRENNWPAVRLDGSTSIKKRQKLVDEFNDPVSRSFAFLLSSKAGGCGINLIGANRLVLFDPDWNPAVDKQAAARIWRDGQKKRCFVYRFVTTGTIEEKIYQRQLSKEGLQSIVDDKEEINSLSSRELRNLFRYRSDTVSDTHEKLKCKRCTNVKDVKEEEDDKELTAEQKALLSQFLLEIQKMPEADKFNCPLDPISEGFTGEQYSQLVRQPIDFSIIRMNLETDKYKTIPGFAKDMHLLFNNAQNLWERDNPIYHQAQVLKQAFLERWTDLAPKLLNFEKNKHANALTKSLNDENEDMESILSQSSYQGQIGMPNEEDLRNWSHHYFPDTIDDVCFKSALVGCEAVSFIFGLTVTWDLIQERTQKEAEVEEARVAARLEMKKALEAEIESDESENEGESDHEAETKTKAENKTAEGKVLDVVNSTVIEYDSFPGLLNGSTSDQSQNEEQDQMEGNKENIFSSNYDEEDEFVSSPSLSDQQLQVKSKPKTRLEKPKRERAEYITDDDDFASLPLQEFNLNAPREKKKKKKTKKKEPKKEKKNKKWNCNRCTFLNSPSSQKCKVCSGSRDGTAEEVAPLLPELQSPPPQEGESLTQTTTSGRKRKPPARFMNIDDDFF